MKNYTGGTIELLLKGDIQTGAPTLASANGRSRQKRSEEVGIRRLGKKLGLMREK